MSGPLPNPQARRRNAPTIQTTVLPAKGRKGRPPKCPYELDAAGAAWWKWAWKLPQATKWDTGSVYLVGRRAQLEDDLAALDYPESELTDLILDAVQADDDDRVRDACRGLERAVGALKRVAGGRTSVMREMRELDNRLGLNPKALAELRWSIGDAEKPEEKKASQGATVRRLRAVDPSAAAS